MNLNPKGAYPVPFHAYQVALEMIRSLQPVLSRIRSKSPALATQAEKAATSVPLNLREAKGRAGKDRTHLWRVAGGSADEVLACLDVAEAWGYIRPSEAETPRDLLDRIVAMTWRLTH